MLVVVAPGQGAHTPGFLTPWLDLPDVADRLSWLSAVAEVDLVRHGTVSDAATIRDTAVAQPLLVGAGLVTLLSLFPQPADALAAVGAGAGHSVGEITAAAATGVITAEQAMVLVRERGRAMAGAAAAAPSGMTAVLGGDTDDVVATIERHGCTAANRNGAGQVVAAGTTAALAALAADPPARARLRPLEVAGAFHTDLMAPAVAVLERHARSITTHDPRTRLLSNADGTVVHDGREVLRRLVSQVSSPVRWDLCMETMRDLGTTAVIEIPPAGTLTALVKRALPGVETLALRTPDDLPAAWDLVARHASPSPVADAPSWRLVVAPGKGTIRIPEPHAEGSAVSAGETVGTVVNLRDEQHVTAAHGGVVVEWLVSDGDPVSPGQPLLRLHPEVPA